MVAGVAALLAFVVVVVLFLPTSCSSDDAPPGAPPSADRCPRGASLSGFIWPHMYLGLALVPVLGLGAGAAAGYLAARRTASRGPR